MANQCCLGLWHFVGYKRPNKMQETDTTSAWFSLLKPQCQVELTQQMESFNNQFLTFSQTEKKSRSTDLTGMDSAHAWNGHFDEGVSRLAAGTRRQALRSVNGDKQCARHLVIDGDWQLSGDIQVGLKRTQTQWMTGWWWWWWWMMMMM